MRDAAAAIHELRKSLAKTIADRTRLDGDHETAIPGMSFCRRSAINMPAVQMYEPSICVIVQGSKQIIAGGDVHDYDETQYLLTSIGLPTVTTVSRATPQEPCLGVMFKLDLRVISQLMIDFELPDASVELPNNSMSIGTMTPQLLGTVKRLVDLLDYPEHSSVLLPLIERELLYWLLIGEHGCRLRQLAMSGSKAHQVAKVADWIRTHYVAPLCISRLAKEADMSISSFHHHFRVIMSMSPLQYQKQLRLHEARRLMLTDTIEAAAAALQVGYESHTQFSREYKRLFGAPPIRDIARLREGGQPQAVAGPVNGRQRMDVTASRRAGAAVNGQGRATADGNAFATRVSDQRLRDHRDLARFWNVRYSEEMLTEF